MIEFDDVFVLYRGTLHDVVALRGLNLSVDRGERVVVHGPSGSGKSTLVKVATSQVTPSAGRVTIMGRVVDSANVRSPHVGSPNVRSTGPRNDRVGVVTQGTGRDLIPELSCLDNIALQARLDGANRSAATAGARAVLQRFDLAHLGHRYPGTLSNGEAQRIGLAAALACEPNVIVADEPTGELDSISAESVYDLLSEQIRATGASLLLVTHDARAARIADRVITIRDGRVSSEHANNEDVLIVDPRGWVRLPQHERAVAGIGDRARVVANPEGLVLQGARTHGLPDHSSEAARAPGGQESPFAAHPRAPAAMQEGIPFGVQPEEAPQEFLVKLDNAAVCLGGTVVLDPSSVTIRKGELTAIVGRSGSGKTTLLAILANLLEPTSGIVHRRPGCTVAVSASVAGFAERLTVRQNVTLACEVRKVSDAGADALLIALGVGHLTDRAMGTLSGGERQRVSVARALVTGADLVLLDEPTSQLDETSAALVSSVLAQLARAGRAIVCTTHDAEIESLAGNVVMLGASTF